MKLQYIEIFRYEERVYQEVAMGDEDAAKKIEAITRGAALNGQDIRQVTDISYEILDAETREVWGRIGLREF